MKLYRKFSRFEVRRHVPRWLEKKLRWALTLKPGDLINDCSGFNHPLVEIEPLIRVNGRGGWYIFDVDFTTEGGGGCSLRHCGVEPAKTREACEKRHLEFLNHWLAPGGPGEQFHGGWENPKHEEYQKEAIKSLFFRWEVLKAGQHISDERGVPFVPTHA